MIRRSTIVLLIGASVMLSTHSCALFVAPTRSSEQTMSLELAVFPQRLSVLDPTSTAEVWATVRLGSHPAADSTLVVFATTAGRITASSLTRDGLAVAELRSPGDGRPRRAEIVAQVKTVRDTMNVELVLFDE